jgi:hypothetical protein
MIWRVAGIWDAKAAPPQVDSDPVLVFSAYEPNAW